MRHLLHPPAAWRDLALLLACVVLGVVLVAHGWQKVNEWGLDGTSASFDKMGVPAPTLSAWFAATVELVGGVLLILGALTPVVALLVVAYMAGAFWFVHTSGGVFVAKGGWELVAVIAAAALALAGAGPAACPSTACSVGAATARTTATTSRRSATPARPPAEPPAPDRRPAAGTRAGHLVLRGARPSLTVGACRAAVRSIVLPVGSAPDNPIGCARRT